MMSKIKCAIIALIGALAINGTASADLTSGLAAHYKFDSCTAVDSSGNNNNGLIKGSLQCIAGMINKALLFDGKSYIRVPSSKSLNPVDQLTIAFWIRADEINNVWPAVIHKGGVQDQGCYRNREYAIYLYNIKAFHLSVAGDGGCHHTLVSNTIPVGKWIHYASVIDRKNHFMRIYINGKLNITTADSYSKFNNNNYDLRIGSTEETFSVNSPLKGALDDIRFYNRALTDVEISGLYNMARPVSGTVNGIKQYSVTCTNITTGQTKTIPLQDGVASWNCESAGMVSNNGNIIDIKIRGVSW